MGSAVSKAPKRAFPKTQRTQRTEPAERTELKPPADSRFTEQPSPAQEEDFMQRLKREGVKDDELGSFLDKLGGAIAGKNVSTLDVKRPPGAQASLRRDAGRLDTEAMRRLFQEVHQMEQRQDKLDAHGLAKRYGVDPILLEKVLGFNRVPAITQAPDGRLFGSWHVKA